ncbi:hypothetical protein [Antrihabitans spumae]|uniref:ARB-07466-like C-terminal domain-containing protein n=1 Tax=Antrihabitans spumae TaxID=3373370 RepID=A0ABW7K0C9_9NOCA
MGNKVVSRGFAAAVIGLAVAALVSAGVWVANGQAPSSEPRIALPAPELLAAVTPDPPQRLVWITPPPSSALPVAAAVAGRPPCETSLAGAQPHVAQVGNFLRTVFGISDIGAANGRGGSGDHGSGLALDLMMSDPALGDAVANYVLANQDAFNVTYVIWQQRYNDGGGWSMMEDRGGATANHYDHVHVSFASAADISLTC